MDDLTGDGQIGNDASARMKGRPDVTLYGVRLNEPDAADEEVVGVNGSPDSKEPLARNTDAKAIDEAERELELTANALADTLCDSETSDDLSAETVAPVGEGTEASLEEIEEDVNLDSFGSGSGLLDLTLHEGDVSLGSILDEISKGEGAPGREHRPDGDANGNHIIDMDTQLSGEGVTELLPEEGEEREPANDYWGVFSEFINVLMEAITRGTLAPWRNLAAKVRDYRPAPRAEEWLENWSFWIPRRHREGITTDIAEDCKELRETGHGEWRVRAHVVWQLFFAVVSLCFDRVLSAVSRMLKREKQG